MTTSTTPLITGLRVIPVAGRDSMLLNLSGAHGPFFTRNLLLLTDSAGRTGLGEVPGGEKIRKTLEDELRLQVADLHLWRLGPGHRGLIVSLVSASPCTADEIKAALRSRHTGLSHVTIEVAVCEECGTPETTKAAE